MAVNTYNNMARLDQRSRERRRQLPAGANQVAAINFLAKLGPELAAMSKRREALPTQVGEDVYPGGQLPPGDVVRVEHYTAAPEFRAFDPSLWGSRGGSGGRGNKEYNRFAANPDIRSSQFYLPDYGSIPEDQITKQAGDVRKIEGYLPGMYNLDVDPEEIAPYVKEQYLRQNPGQDYVPIDQGENLMAREAARRGYAGTYHENVPGSVLGTRLDVMTPVDLTGAAPNIPAMRTMLGLKTMPGQGEVPMPTGSTAQVTTETMPGAGVMPERYRLYEDNPTAGAMLHRDYEQLLRNPDGSSVVGQMLGVNDTSTRQSTGVFRAEGAEKSQRNPMSQQRVAVTPPRVDASADPETIKEQAVLSADDRAKMNALAVTEGKLRDQDAAAWGYPIHMTAEADMPLAGLPWENVNAAVFRSPGLQGNEVKTVADEIYSIPVPEKYDAGNMDQLIAVTPAPDGDGGIMLMNIGMDNDDFQQMTRTIRGNHPMWERSGMTTEWGTYDGDYIMAKDYDKTIEGLPRDLRQKSERALERLGPMTGQIKSYHDQLRESAPGAVPARPEAPQPAEQIENQQKVKNMMELLRSRGQF